MSRKGKRKQQAKAKRPAPPPKPTLGRYYRHHRETIHKVLRWAGITAGAVVLVALAVFLLQKHSISLTKSDYLKEARKRMALGYFDQAILSYHQAENADPADKTIPVETAMARARIDLLQGGSASRAIGATAQVLVDDSTLAFAHAGLAQLLARQGNLKDAISHSYATLRYFPAQKDTPSALAVALILAEHYRHADQFDSAAAYGEMAIDYATVVGDPLHLMLAKSDLGLAKLRQGQLEQGRLFFEDLLARVGNSGPYYEGLGKVGLADFFQRSGNPDSAIYYAQSTENALVTSGPNEVSAYSAQVEGRSLRDRGDLVNSVAKLQNSLSNWVALRSQADLIDCANDLAISYYDQKDYFNARKYYYVAAKLAAKYGFAAKDRYGADMNLRFLKNLSQDQYLAAGNEGDALVKQYSVW
jgi:hypothetical protein